MQKLIAESNAKFREIDRSNIKENRGGQAYIIGSLTGY